MKDRVTQYPGRIKLTPVPGEENTYDMERADEPTQEGDPLNKATFLKDATAAMFGLDANAVPDDVHNWVGQYNNHWWSVLNTSTGSTTYVNSTNRNAYPDDATEGNLTYRYLGIPFDNAVKAPKLETGSYVGTGVYGADNPNSLTFEFVPKVVFVVPDTSTQRGNGMILVQGASTFGGFGTFYTTTGTETLTNVLISWSGKSVSWYCPTNYEGEVYQQNESGVTYRYVAFE